MKHSILNCPATHAVSYELVLSFMHKWLSWANGSVIGFSDSREDAEQICKDHAMCESVELA